MRLLPDYTTTDLAQIWRLGVGAIDMHDDAGKAPDIGPLNSLGSRRRKRLGGRVARRFIYTLLVNSIGIAIVSDNFNHNEGV